jgi:O-antigen/teichoic acid export membrane protein
MKGIKGILSLSVGDYGGAIIVSAFWFLLAFLISPEEYGEIHYFIGIAGLAFSISLLTTQETIVVYTAKNVKLAPTLFLISLIAGGIAAVVVTALFSRVDSSFLLLGFIVNDLAIGYIVGKKLFTKYPKYFLLQKSLTFVLGISFFYLFGVEGIIFAIALSYGHFLFIIAKVFRTSSIDFSLLKKHRGFIGNNYFMNVSGAVRSHIDKIIIVPLIGFEILGNYALALQIYAVLMIFSNIIYRYALPHDASGTSTRKIKLIGLSYAVGVSMLGFTILPMIVPQIFEKFNDIGPAIQIISLAIIPTTIGLFYTSQILGREKSSVILASRILGSISIIAMLVVLAPLYGMVGAASAFVLSALVGCVFLVCAEYYRTHNQRN